MTNTNERPAEEEFAKNLKEVIRQQEEGGEWEKLEMGLLSLPCHGRLCPHETEKRHWIITDEDLSRVKDALSCTRKEAEAATWKAAVEAIEEKKRTDRRELITHTGKVELVEVYPSQNDAGWMLARQQLITAAKESGVNLEV